MIIARCHPALEPLLPKPQPAARALPDWLRTMPSEAPAPALGGAAVRTLKHCPPFIDALSLGLLIPLATDLHFDNGHVSWDWDFPVLPDSAITRAPVGMHLPEQASGVPWQLAINAVLKFMNFWTLETAPGISLLFTHPFNREDLPFRTLTGVVDSDLFRDGYVHFPALWQARDFTGTLPAGTPVAQVIPLPRTELNLQVTTMTDTQINANRALQQTLSETPGTYRRHHRH